MTEIDPRLRTELGHRAGQIDVTGDFATRAIEIETRAQKRRVATAAIGSALALAVTAPLVYSAMTPEATQPVPASSTTAPVPTPTSSAPIPTSSAPAPTASAPTSVAPTAIPTFDTGTKALVTALPRLGPATGTPDVPYAVDGVLHDDDREVPLPARTSVYELARLDHGGAFVRWDTDMGSRSALVDATGKELASLGAYEYAVNDDGSRILAAGDNGLLRLLDSKGDTITEMKSGGYRPVALLGDQAFAASLEGAETLVWNTSTGGTRTIKGSMVRDVNAARGLALMLEPQDLSNPGEVCYAIIDVDTLAARSRACGPFLPMSFSPQGNYVLATGTLDGAGPLGSITAIRVDDGRVALRIDDSIGAWTVRMDDGETGVTFSASEAGPAGATNNALVRCDLSGACVVVGDSRKMAMIGGLPASVWAVSQN